MLTSQLIQEKAINKIQHCFMIEMLNKFNIQEMQHYKGHL